MSTYRRNFLLALLKASDLLLMVIAFILTSAYTIRTDSAVTLTEFFSIRIKLVNFILFAVFLLLWHWIFVLFKLYDSRRLSSYLQDCADTFRASSCAALVLALFSLPHHIRMLTPTFLIVFWAISAIFAMSGRLTLRYVLVHVRLAGRNLRHLLIAGTNARALQFAQMIDSRPELGYRILGFVDDDRWNRSEAFSRAGYQIVSDFAGLPSFLRDSVVDEMIIALPLGSMHQTAARIVRICEEQGITSAIPSEIFNLRLARVRADNIEDAPLITNYAGLVDGWPMAAKRCVDVVLSAILLAAVFPILLLAAVLIKLTSPGPVIFTQYRLGLNKHKFKIYKLRTMIADAELQMRDLEHLNEVSGPVFKIKNDPRITRIGKFLRTMSIDELPQLLNVLKGDMSLVGPRPLPLRDYDGFSDDWQRRRFAVRPGITCLWQIDGRSNVPFERWMQLDLQYIDKWSLWLDFRILARTIPAVLRGSGAV